MSKQPVPQTAPDLWEVIRTASAVRRYRDEPVSDKAIDACLRAASWAPSRGNQQPWKFVVLRSSSVRDVVTAAADKTRDITTEFYRLPMSENEADGPKSRVLRAMAEHMSIGGSAPAPMLFGVQPQRKEPPNYSNRSPRSRRPIGGINPGGRQRHDGAHPGNLLVSPDIHRRP